PHLASTHVAFTCRLRQNLRSLSPGERAAPLHSLLPLWPREYSPDLGLRHDRHFRNRGRTGRRAILTPRAVSDVASSLSTAKVPDRASECPHGDGWPIFSCRKGIPARTPWCNAAARRIQATKGRGNRESGKSACHQSGEGSTLSAILPRTASSVDPSLTVR